ncbi:hypothetical protein Aau02nite_65290 [Amorphoplanes auranticolor]|uniref:Tn3 transposase DDE domain-containing protein n=1 Tax=Actinoplanes auranticolor TaxID=47988 RepID=A0A919SNB1_9ACTN|nr:hypothetical protein Aau02nite_65290 [Actinoplanes auranticolor]
MRSRPASASTSNNTRLARRAAASRQTTPGGNTAQQSREHGAARLGVPYDRLAVDHGARRQRLAHRGDDICWQRRVLELPEYRSSSATNAIVCSGTPSTWTSPCGPARAGLSDADADADADVARLSPYVRHHIRVHGHYTFTLSDLRGGTYRTLRNPDGADEQ